MKETYLNLIEQGWNLKDIDDMDIIYYWEIQAYKAGKEQKTEYIDQVLM